MLFGSVALRVAAMSRNGRFFLERVCGEDFGASGSGEELIWCEWVSAVA